MDMDEAEEDMDEEDRVVPIPDWLDIINRENFADLSSPPSLAHSSALKILPDHRANNGGPTSEEGVALPATALTYYADIDPAAQDGWTVGERHLLNHFLQAVARSMAMVEDRQNPFIRLIVPLAFESAAVRNALAALSATHLSKVYPDFERNHLLHRDMALEDLKWRLGSLETSISSLAATLLLCIGEVCCIIWHLMLQLQILTQGTVDLRMPIEKVAVIPSRGSRSTQAGGFSEQRGYPLEQLSHRSIQLHLLCRLCDIWRRAAAMGQAVWSLHSKRGPSRNSPPIWPPSGLVRVYGKD
jgi:hypothetical protein